MIDPTAADLKSGHTSRCRKCSITTHGESHTPEYQAYRSMISRCYNPKHVGFEYWGGRGIRVCPRWLDSVSGLQHFLADMWPRPPGYSIEREDNDGDYSPSNCYWIPRPDQARNKRNNRLVTAFGKTMLVVDWCRERHIPMDTLLKRLNNGEAPERALRPALRYAVMLAVQALKEQRSTAEVLAILEPQIPRVT